MAKILIVEDDPMIAEIYQKKFADSGFEVLAALTGEQAVKILEKEKVDLVMSDLIMPRMDGFELTKKIRENFDPEIKIIITSNLSQSEDQNKALQLGANGFIAKSDFNPSDLVKEVSRLMNQYDEQAKNFSKQEDEGASSGGGEKKRILMMEDEAIFVDMFGEKLKQDGYDVLSASNGAWGLKEALKEKFDLIIIDMVMPAMTGEEIVARLKMEEETKNIPIIVLSASVEDEAAKKVREMGIVDFFVKTQITPSELSKRIKEALAG